MFSIRCCNYIGLPDHLDCHWRGRVRVRGVTKDEFEDKLLGLDVAQCSVDVSTDTHSTLCSLQQHLRTSQDIPPGLPWDRCSPAVQRTQRHLVENHRHVDTTAGSESVTLPGVAGLLSHRPHTPDSDSS